MITTYINQMLVISKSVCPTKLLFSKNVTGAKICLTFTKKIIQIAFMASIIIPFNPAAF